MVASWSRADTRVGQPEACMNETQMKGLAAPQAATAAVQEIQSQAGCQVQWTQLQRMHTTGSNSFWGFPSLAKWFAFSPRS